MEPLVITGIGELATNDPVTGTLSEGAVVTEGEAVAWAGPAGDLPSGWAGARTIDVEGRAVMPGFVDAHTHLVFAGDRSDEFARRMAGESYADISAAGGGILSTVAATRSADRRRLVAGARRRMERMLAAGTTTVEIKSGYGLDIATELLMLEVAEEAAAGFPLTLRRTFLGAHTVPSEYRTDPAAYVELVVEEMLPVCAPHADYCDVFVEEGAFGVEEARRILTAAASHGLGARVHAEQLGHSGGAALAAELGAVSADHLDHITTAEAKALAAAGTVATLVPGASFQLRSPQAPGPMLWDAGVTVAIATDCNPGTSYVESMPFVVALAVTQMGLTVEQAVWAATRGGALSLGMDDRGRLAPGDRADLIVLDAPSVAHLAYRPATPLVSTVITGGKIRT
ncbi:MAG TPA: imidazolonepropionase [Acidimicrobiia bacterium]|nr:imidazolonepropionase [Acidimicrobiia bacterium]